MNGSVNRRTLLRVGGIAGGSLLAGVIGSGQVLPVSAGSAPFMLNGFTVDEPFATYWQEHGGLAQQGLPLSNRFDEVSPTNGRSYSVQYFERARFEYHPENQPPYNVLLGLLGREQFLAKYPGGQPGVTPPPPALRSGETLRVDGANLTVTFKMQGDYLVIPLVYTNTSGSPEDFTQLREDRHLSDDAEGIWTFLNDGSPQRYILDPNKQLSVIDTCFARDKMSDRRLAFTVAQFGKIRNATWTATLSQGLIK